MRCPNCKNDNPNGFRFCLQCGEDLGAPTVVQQPETVTRVRVPLREAASDTIPSKRGNWWIYSLLAACLAALLIVAVLASAGFLYFNSNAEESNKAKQQASPAAERARSSPTRQLNRDPTLEPTQVPTLAPPPSIEPTQAPMREPTAEPAEPHALLAKSLLVPARQMVWYTFTLPVITRVHGHFRASGGGNDIYAVLVDDDGLENFRNGHGAKVFYSSGGYITTDTIDCRLAPGRYHMVFSNTKALLTNKMVDVTLEADY
jgi:hypothetical protein